MQTSDFIALLALIISIISLMLQSKGINQQLQVSNISEYTKRYQGIFEKLPKSVISEEFSLNSLPEDEIDKVLRYVWLYFDMCYEQYAIYHELKIVDKKVWSLWEAGMVSALSRVAFQECWTIISQVSFYPSHFSDFINNIVKRHLDLK